MTIGVDASVIVAGLHANHPRHALAAGWITRALGDHKLVVCHHTVLETYAVLTRLPSDFRVTPSEAKDLLVATVKAHMTVVPFSPEGIWGIVERLTVTTASGGRSYDAFVAECLQSAGAEAVATFDPGHFRGLTALDVIDPQEVPI